jgi:hypothetical protein
MNPRTAFVPTIAALVLLCCTPRACADSDGYFCAGKGYLAYEVNKHTPPPKTGHSLQVVRFDSARGIYRAGAVELQNFQVHQMSCGEDRVDIAGWGKYFQKYAVAISGPDELHILNFTEDPARKFDPSKEGPEPANFAFDKRDAILLESSDAAHKYQLRLTRSEKSVQGGIRHSFRAELLQLDLNGAVLQRLLVYKSQSLETID